MNDSHDLEMQIVAASCRWPNSTAKRDLLARLLASGPDWERTQSLAKRHGVTGLLADALLHQPATPEAVRDQCRRVQNSLLAKNLRSAAQQSTLLNQLQSDGVQAVVLKGAPLAVRAFGGLHLRSSRDVDLLIAPRNVPAARQVLERAGYRRVGLSADLNPRHQQAWLSIQKHEEYTNDRLRLELHWRTEENHFLCDDVDAILARREGVAITQDLNLPAIQSSAQILALCLHGAGHAWFRLKWLADVNALLAQMTFEQRQALVATARRNGVDRPLLQAMVLCERFFGSSFAAHRLALPVRCLVRIATSAILQQDVSSASSQSDFVPKQWLLSRLLLHRNFRYKLEELRLRMHSPADWNLLHLPERLHFVFPVLRAPLWVARRLKRNAD